MLQENPMVLIEFCLKQKEDIACKFFGNKKTGQLGWQVGELDMLWTASVRYVSKFNSDISSSYKDYQDTYKGDKRKEMMWIHHFVILQLSHPKFHRINNVVFYHDNSSLFVCQFTPEKQQEYTNIFNDFPNFNWLWLGRNIGN